MLELHQLPTLNAALNSLSAVFLVLGLAFIRNRRRRAHRAMMLAACATSIAFLVSYLAYHFQTGSTRFQSQGWIRPLYFTILVSHTILAAAIVPLVIMTLIRALRGRFDQHRRIARWTWPVWMYVSLTGVVIYILLYHVDPALSGG